MEPSRYPYVLVDVEPDASDETSYELFALGAQGVEERDATTLIKGTPGKVTLVASFASHQEANAAIASIARELNPRLEEVVGDAWRDEWKKYFRPFAICPDLVIRPSWEAYETKPGERVLELEPGRAFGTGLHESTSLVAGCIHRSRASWEAKPILDVGCGSGILSLVALALGAKSARGIDIDADAIKVANENAARNGMADRSQFDTTSIGQIRDRYPLVLANIEAFVLIPLAANIARAVEPGGLLILSGVLLPQRDDVIAAYPAFEVVETPERGEWTAIVLRAPRNG